MASEASRRICSSSGRFTARNSSRRFYVHIDWKRRVIALHGENSPALDRLAYDDEIPDNAGEVFGETEGGLWRGHFGSYAEALGFSKLLNDIYHKQTGEYLLIDYFSTARSEKPEHAHAV